MTKNTDKPHIFAHIADSSLPAFLPLLIVLVILAVPVSRTATHAAAGGTKAAVVDVESIINRNAEAGLLAGMANSAAQTDGGDPASASDSETAAGSKSASGTDKAQTTAGGGGGSTQSPAPGTGSTQDGGAGQADGGGGDSNTNGSGSGGSASGGDAGTNNSNTNNSNTNNTGNTSGSPDSTGGSVSGGPYTDGSYRGGARGYKSMFYATVTIQNGWIAGISIEQADDEEYMSQCTGIINQIINQQTTDGIDTVSGCTLSSNGILGSVRAALDQCRK
ncbi:MAG: FMN-binding protein [Clostridiales Family XIII bacterium]|jgi:uncharacterized protein with FMN-binding domain|nr:FMN-binding protein [Clostridiales Family XIII bacterium]